MWVGCSGIHNNVERPWMAGYRLQSCPPAPPARPAFSDASSSGWVHVDCQYNLVRGPAGANAISCTCCPPTSILGRDGCIYVPSHSVSATPPLCFFKGPTHSDDLNTCCHHVVLAYAYIPTKLMYITIDATRGGKAGGCIRDALPARSPLR